MKLTRNGLPARGVAILALVSFSGVWAATAQAVEDSFVVEVANPKDTASSQILVRGGYPFGAGVVPRDAHVTLKDAQGKSVPLQTRALAFWPDTSVKWLELTFVLPAIEARATVELKLAPNADVPPEAGAVAVTLPERARYTLSDASGDHPFATATDSLLYQGPLASEKRYSGRFGGRMATDGSIAVTAFRDLGATRYVFAIEQLEDGDTWTGLKAFVPHRSVYVRNAKPLGAVVTSSDEGSEVVFFAGNEPVDTGVGRCWEVWGFEDPQKLAGSPLAPQAHPEYLQRTGALGQFAVDVPETWARTFDESVQRLFEARDANPRNFGWRHYGCFFDRSPKTGLAYYGYLNQEYDPSTALILLFARTGNLEYFSHARDLAELFRDMSVSPEGGVYQHRATIHAMEAHILRIASASLERKIRRSPRFASNVDGLTEALIDVYGTRYGDLRAPIREVLEPHADLPFDRQVTFVADTFAGALMDEALDKYRADFERAAKATPGEAPMPSIRDLACVYAQDDAVSQLGFSDPDGQFNSFFARYGGSWDDFPAFHEDILPVRKRHEGGHSLAEMLARMYCLTGDESYKDVALRVARHQLKEIVPFVLEQNRGSVKNSDAIHTRQLSWPLILLLSVWDITEVAEPDLHAQVVDACRRLAYQLTENAADQHQGGIHAGIGMESLARYHEKTGDKRVADYLVKWARYWAESQWDRGQGFRYIHGEKGSGDVSMTALVFYGLAYAHDLAPDSALKARVLEAQDLLLEQGPQTYAKTFAMHYRSVPRGLELTRRWARTGAPTQ